MKKRIDLNRESAAKIISLLSRVRGECTDMGAKRRLRELEEKLAVASPSDSEEIEFIDEELVKRLTEFSAVAESGVLTERYLDRIEELITRRRTL